MGVIYVLSSWGQMTFLYFSVFFFTSYSVLRSIKRKKENEVAVKVHGKKWEK